MTIQNKEEKGTPIEYEHIGVAVIVVLIGLILWGAAGYWFGDDSSSDYRYQCVDYSLWGWEPDAEGVMHSSNVWRGIKCKDADGNTAFFAATSSPQ